MRRKVFKNVILYDLFKIDFLKSFFFILKGDNGKLKNDFDKLIGEFGCIGKLYVFKLCMSYWICFFLKYCNIIIIFFLICVLE